MYLFFSRLADSFENTLLECVRIFIREDIDQKLYLIFCNCFLFFCYVITFMCRQQTTIFLHMNGVGSRHESLFSFFGSTTLPPGQTIIMLRSAASHSSGNLRWWATLRLQCGCGCLYLSDEQTESLGEPKSTHNSIEWPASVRERER